MGFKRYLKSVLIIATMLDGNAYAQTIGTDAGYIGTEPPVGALPLTIDVNQVGAAVGSMPLDLPKGFADIAPQIGLSYSSSLGLCNMGYGFTLSGVSAIAVAGQDYWHDENVTPVQFNADDRFYLDGERLILASGTYGENNATYWTENYNYATITSKGSTNLQPESFTIVTKDGSTLEYGGTAAITKVSNNGTTKITSWLIKKMTDKRGNYIEYVYNNTTDGQTKLTEIKYTGNANDNIEPQYSVKINYGTRTAEYSYVSGYRLTNSLYINNITVTDSKNTEIVKYTFVYSNNQLATINKYYMGRQVCKPTSIEWKGTTAKYSALIDNGIKPSEFLKAARKFETYNGDVDGDMQPDVVRVNRTDNCSFAYYTKVGNQLVEKYKGKLPTNNQVNYYDEKTEIYEYYNGQYYLSETRTDHHSYNTKIPLPYTFFDIDKDGNLELCVIESTKYDKYENANFYAYKLNENGLTKLDKYTKTNIGKITLNNLLIAGSFDGTGHIDLVPYRKNSKSVNSNNIINFDGIVGNFRTYFELNGDCKTEILTIKDNTINIYAPETGDGKINMVLKATITESYIDSQRGLEIADFNGDGLTDILIYNNGWKLYLNIGGKFQLQSAATNELNASRKVTQGYSTVAISASPNQRDYDNGYARIATIDLKNAFSNVYKVADFDGDGRCEILRIERDVTFTKYDAEDVICSNYRIKIFKYNGTSFTCVKTYSTVSFRQKGSEAATASADPDSEIGNFEYCSGQLVGGETNFEITDYNEDGFPELLVSSTRPVVINGVLKENSEVALQFYSGQPRQFLNSVTNGMGVKTQLNYNKINSNNYTQTTETLSSNVYSQPAQLWVVTNKKISAGSVVASNINYHYQNLLIHPQRGLLGFRITTATDAVSNNKNENTYNYDATHIVPYIEEQRRYYGNQTMEYTAFEYNFKNKGTNSYVQQLTYTKNDGFAVNQTITNYKYFDNGNLKEITTKYGSDATDITTFESYTTLGKPQKVTTKRTQSGMYFSYSLSYTYDTYGNVLTETDSRTGIKTTYTYDSKNHTNIKTITEDGLNTETTISYDATKRFATSKTTKYADNTTLTTSATYDDFGRTLTKTDINGLKTSYTYDNFGQLAIVNQPDGDFTATVYNWITDKNRTTITNYVKTKNRLGDTKTIYYDALGRELKRIVTPTGGTAETISTYYRSDGNIDRVESNVNGTTSYTYNQNYGYVSSVTAQGRTINYSRTSISETTTINGVATTKSFNNLNQVRQVTDAASKIEYTYHPCGSPLTITAAGATTSMEYDAQGRQTKLTDPDAGATAYEYDNLGRLTKQTDARGVITTITYDDFGRETTRSEKMGSTTRTVSTIYYTAKPHIGLVKSQTDSQSGIVTTYTYDNYNRLLTKTDKIDNQNYTTTYGYDSYGRNVEITYPSDEHITYTYSGNYITAITDQNGVKLISGVTYNARGQVTGYDQANGNPVVYKYDDNGYPNYINFGQTNQRINYSYTWNAQTQNLTTRSMGVQQDAQHGYLYSEQFTYDIADRLTMWKVQYPFKTGSYTYTADYSDNGNIVLKSDFGYYSYSKKTKPHAVSGISSLIAGTGDERTCEAEYNTIGKVSKLTLKNGNTTLKTATFTYAADGQRRRMTTNNSATVYSGDYQVNRYNGGGEQQLHYISGPAGLCALIVRNYSYGRLNSRTIYHLQTDYQGSIIAAYNSNGTLYRSFAYDPWGRRRVGDNWNSNLVATETLITRGYCGHEHLDDFGTINMNGRIYDPRLGRFLSPDPYVQAPYNSQNYNRYSYCLNNPLKYTDPSGKLFKELLSVISTPIAFVTGAANWIINGGSFRNGFSETYKGWRNYGKAIDNKIFHNGAATAYNNATASSPYATGTPHIFVASNGDIYEGYYFETLYDMSNFMWYKSEEIGIEISAYILRDDNGKDYYWVNDWKGNSPEHCENPHYLQAGKKGVRMDNKRIVAEFHTHPSVNFTGDKENVYDGPSYNDYFISVQLGIPVYTIGPTSVSRIYWETSEYKTQEDFNKLAVIQNKYDMRSLVPSLFVNPFSIGRRSDWLKNPYYQEPFWWH